MRRLIYDTPISNSSVCFKISEIDIHTKSVLASVSVSVCVCVRARKRVVLVAKSFSCYDLSSTFNIDSNLMMEIKNGLVI